MKKHQLDLLQNFSAALGALVKESYNCNEFNEEILSSVSLILQENDVLEFAKNDLDSFINHQNEKINLK